MNIEKIYDIRFLAPPAVMVLVLFCYSPMYFLDLVEAFSGVSWIVSAIGLLSVGFVLSSLVEFLFHCSGIDRTGKYPHDYLKIFKEEHPIHVTSAKELAVWIHMEGERNKSRDSQIPDQIHKRWNISMANFNIALGIVVAAVLAPELMYWTNTPYVVGYFCVSLLFALVFLVNGIKAFNSVRHMTDLISARNHKDSTEG